MVALLGVARGIMAAARRLAAVRLRGRYSTLWTASPSQEAFHLILALIEKSYAVMPSLSGTVSLTSALPRRVSARKYRKKRVIDRRIWRHHTRFRNRDNESAAAFAISGLLPHHLPREIP